MVATRLYENIISDIWVYLMLCYRDAGRLGLEVADLVRGAGGVHRGAHNQCDQVHHRRHGCTGMEYLYLFSHIIKVWLAVQKLKTVFFKQVS